MREPLRMIRDLGRALDQEWAAKGYALDAFPAIAGAGLKRARLHARLPMRKLVAGIAEERELPPQLSPHSSFGQPPVTLFATDRFVIDAYFWSEPATSIHSHSFCGAFTVLHGTSLHVPSRFRSDGPERELFATGRLVPGRLELLRRGDVRPFRFGPSSTHQVVHLSFPSVSITVRTVPHPEIVLQRIYTPAGLAVTSDQHLSETVRRKCQLLAFLRTTGSPGLADAARRMLRGANDADAFWILSFFHHASKDPVALGRILSDPRLPRRPWQDRFLRTMAWEDQLDLDWRRLTGEGERLLITLLSSGARGPEIRRILGLYCGRGRIAERAGTWIEGLSERKAAGFALNATATTALAAVLAGGGEREACRAIARRCDVPDRRALRADVRRCLRDLKAIPLFRPLFAR